jgi:hypothetical protein
MHDPPTVAPGLFLAAAAELEDFLLPGDYSVSEC